LCADCGQPVRVRRLITQDFRVTPDGAVDYDSGPIANGEAEQEYGLYCSGCGCFLAGDYGPMDPIHVPELLEEGRLKRRPR
jgi:hypothetical protein